MPYRLRRLHTLALATRIQIGYNIVHIETLVADSKVVVHSNYNLNLRFIFLIIFGFKMI